mmetsp:Transcript_19274/g.49060  ORF Transcript_19274/g.49060 Transcript_19274/m.49060 type:complete len:304 (+) Transcript_19274:1795-2706(+)
MVVHRCRPLAQICIRRHDRVQAHGVHEAHCRQRAGRLQAAQRRDLCGAQRVEVGCAPHHGAWQDLVQRVGLVAILHAVVTHVHDHDRGLQRLHSQLGEGGGRHQHHGTRRSIDRRLGVQQARAAVLDAACRVVQRHVGARLHAGRHAHAHAQAAEQQHAPGAGAVCRRADERQLLAERALRQARAAAERIVRAAAWQQLRVRLAGRRVRAIVHTRHRHDGGGAGRLVASLEHGCGDGVPGLGAGQRLAYGAPGAHEGVGGAVGLLRERERGHVGARLDRVVALAVTGARLVVLTEHGAKDLEL